MHEVIRIQTRILAASGYLVIMRRGIDPLSMITVDRSCEERLQCFRSSEALR